MLVLAVGNHSSRSLVLSGLASLSSYIRHVDIKSVEPDTPIVSSVSLRLDDHLWVILRNYLLGGYCGGLAMSMGRTIMQQLVPESHRASVMSVLSLANVDAVPFGAALMGFCAEYLGILSSFLVAVASAWLKTA